MRALRIYCPASATARRMGGFTSRDRALCNDGRWVKANPVLNSARNVSFTVTHMDEPGLRLVCRGTRAMGVSNNVDNSGLKLPPSRCIKRLSRQSKETVPTLAHAVLPSTHPQRLAIISLSPSVSSSREICHLQVIYPKEKHCMTPFCFALFLEGVDQLVKRAAS